jgi:mannan endo-1,6-alpha-mannosidase
MAALSVIGTNLNNNIFRPKTTTTGATSKGDPDAGSEAPAIPGANSKKITTGDQAGAGILTLLAAVFVIGGAIWLVT